MIHPLHATFRYCKVLATTNGVQRQVGTRKSPMTLLDLMQSSALLIVVFEHTFFRFDVHLHIEIQLMPRAPILIGPHPLQHATGSNHSQINNIFCAT